MKRLNWDEYFLKICEVVALRSLDEDTKLGCVIVNENNHIVATGYNSLPAGVYDDSWPVNRLSKLDVAKDNYGVVHIIDGVPKPTEGVTYTSLGEITKYDVMAHAEVNAIVSSGQPLKSCKLYCTYLPCAECAKAIITSGIKEIYYVKENPRFEKSYAIAREFFDQSGVVYNKVEI